MNSTSNSTARPFAYNTSASNVVAATFVALLILLNLAGNIIVCVCFYYFRELRTICNYFIISLSLADICVALFGMPFWLVLQLTDNIMDYKYIFSDQVYMFWTCMDILVGTASIMNLAAVSFDRQLAITSPFSYPKILTHNRVMVLIFTLWVYSIGITSVRAIDFLRSSYILLVTVLNFFLPLAVMFIMYARIYCVARSQARRMGRNYSRDIKAAKTIAIVIGTFLICWMPFFLIGLSVYLYNCCVSARYNPAIMMPALKAVKWMAYLNSCLNPIIYTCLNRTYRRAFYKLFMRCSCSGRLSRELTAYTESSTQKKNGVEKIEFITKGERDSCDNCAVPKRNSIVTFLRSPRAFRNVRCTNVNSTTSTDSS